MASLLIGAGGVLLLPATYWNKVQEVCRRYDLLVVADEVINGFGRLGTTFACEYYEIEPDILVVLLQITSSYLLLAAVLMSDKIYQGVADGSDALGTLAMGSPPKGHPVATAAGVENLKILEGHRLRNAGAEEAVSSERRASACLAISRPAAKASPARSVRRKSAAELG